MSELAHDEDGKLVQVAPSPLDEIVAQEIVEFCPQELELTSPEIEAALEAMDKLLKWVWQSGMKNADGVKIRAIILCWVCLKELRAYSLTQIATGYGMDKQSLGRWVDDFKKRYPTVRTPHMR